MPVWTKNTRHFLAVTSLFVVILFLFFYEITLGGRTFKVGNMIAGALPDGTYLQSDNRGIACPTFLRETASIEEPFYQFLKTNFWKGVFPLWNPHQCCGLPTSLTMEAGVYFPLTAVLYLLPNTVSMDVLFLLRLLVGCLLMYWLMRAWGFGVLSRLAAALVFTLTGPMVVHHAWIVNVDLILPLLFLSAYKLFSSRTRPHRLLFSLAVALSVLGGQIEHIFLTHFLATAYVLFLFGQEKHKDVREKIRIARDMVLFYFWGIGMSAVALWPFLADFFHTWTTHTEDCGTYVQSLYGWAKEFITIFVPAFFQEPMIPIKGSTQTWGGGYLGVLAVLLGLLGLGLKRQRPLVLFFGVGAFLLYGIASSAFYTQWIGSLPVFNLMRLPAHVLYLFVFCVAFLCGAGIEVIVNDPGRSVRRIWGIVVGLAALIIVYLLVYRYADFASQALKASALALGLLVVLGLWLLVWQTKTARDPRILGIGLIALLTMELFAYAPRCRPKRFDSFPTVPYIEFLSARMRESRFRVQGMFMAFYRNTAMAYGLDSFVGSHTVLPYRYVNFVQDLVSPNFYSKICPGSGPVLTEVSAERGVMDNMDMMALANVNYFVLPRYSRLSPYAIYNDEAKVFPLRAFFPLPAAPRAYVVHDWTILEGEGAQAVLDRIRRDRISVIPRAIVESSLGEGVPRPSAGGEVLVDPAKEVKRWANGVILEAATDRQALLVLADAYFPGWKAWVDGRLAKIYPVNYLFRGVFLPPGTHRIEFRFVPFWFYLGLGVTVLSFAGWLYLAIRSRRK